MSEFGKSLLSSLASGIGGGLSSVAGSLGSAISGGLGQLFKSIQDKREHEYFTKRADYQQQLQHETMDKQQQQTIDFWNMQNEYNDPAAVASRYRNAGINPLSAFGGSVVGLGASSAPMPSAGSAYGAGAGGSSLPSMDSPASVGQLGVELGGLDLERQNVQGLNLLRSAQRDTERAKQFLSREEAENLKQIRRHNDATHPLTLQQMEQDFKNSQQIYEKLKAETGKTEEEKLNLKVAREGMEIENAILNVQLNIYRATGMQKAQAEIAQIYANCRYLNESADLADANERSVEQQILLRPVQVTYDLAKTMTGIVRDYSDIQLNEKQIQRLEKEIQQIDVDNGFKFVDKVLSAYDTVINEHFDREVDRERTSSRSGDTKTYVLGGLLRTALVLATKGK